ncbi:dihydrolipoamide dehydrogenase [Dethiosulfatibacter aminovorans DSM 17477]|uniref:Dihydrolipoyl dehydrogenase n=1 Tax=Dethiosulfatibacter aminovorans DSM 17477 TaxID=1121476 RepID=A0A1M6AP45_9FIRM|nr:dihydrolipoyl dehydrogenase [Dethiosulfatibacter aminovorans]SHI38108.1 dihydrolipoamide dehydrogenase [Dethiosulfatibacter aminovorans DSM 17477]
MHIVVIGGGPGGYVSAIRASQLGAKVTIVEKKHFGGTCLNVGCIPTKVLLHTSELYRTMLHESSELGIDIGQVSLNWPNLQKRKDAIVSQLVGGVEVLLNSNGVSVINGEASFTGKNQICVRDESHNETIVDFDKAIIASGSESIILPIKGVDNDGVITSTEALSLEEIPESMCIIGGGVIGCEFASLYSSMGCDVTIVEMLPELISVMDKEIVGILKEELLKNGVGILTSTRVNSIGREGDGLLVETDKDAFKVDKVLLATGRRPKTDGLNLEAIGVKTERGAIVVNPLTMQTNIGSIYAIGDCNGGILLAHVASAEGTVAAEHAMNKKSKMDMRTTPSAVYTRPEIASVGMTEEEAVKTGYGIKVGRFPLYANGKSLIMGEGGGLVKFVVDESTDEILGIHMAGPRATDLISEGCMALRLEATVEEVISTIHAHPTVSEAFHEAAHAVHSSAIHLPK